VCRDEVPELGQRDERALVVVRIAVTPSFMIELKSNEASLYEALQRSVKGR
jgi:hypothetical protein